MDAEKKVAENREKLLAMLEAHLCDVHRRNLLAIFAIYKVCKLSCNQ